MRGLSEAKGSWKIILDALAHRVKRLWREVRKGLIVEHDAPAARPVERDDQPGQRGFTAAAFAYEAERLATLEDEVHVVEAPARRCVSGPGKPRPIGKFRLTRSIRSTGSA